jgi:hypothetical protein
VEQCFVVFLNNISIHPYTNVVKEGEAGFPCLPALVGYVPIILWEEGEVHEPLLNFA